MYPLKAGWAAIRSASLTREALLRLMTIRPWWLSMAQKEQEPKHPRLLVSENWTSLSAGTPPSLS